MRIACLIPPLGGGTTINMTRRPKLINSTISKKLGLLLRFPGTEKSSPLPRSHGLAKVPCQQVGCPIAFPEFQIADNGRDSEPFHRWQFVPRHLQMHTSTHGRSLDQKRRLPTRRPTENY